MLYGLPLYILNCVHQVFRPVTQTETKSRYTTEELLTKSLLLRTISERVVDRELFLLARILDSVLGFAPEIRRVADFVGRVDLETTFALQGLGHFYVRPTVVDGCGRGQLEIVDGRHPILDKLFSSPGDENESLRHFTPNSLSLSSNSTNKSIV